MPACYLRTEAAPRERRIFFNPLAGQRARTAVLKARCACPVRRHRTSPRYGPTAARMNDSSARPPAATKPYFVQSAGRQPQVIGQSRNVRIRSPACANGMASVKATAPPAISADLTAGEEAEQPGRTRRPPGSVPVSCFHLRTSRAPCTQISAFQVPGDTQATSTNAYRAP